MSYCTNVGCINPQNPNTTQYCTSCGKHLLLNNRYRSVALIGSGGFGRTFLAVDEHLPSKPECVIKQLCFPKQNADNFNKAVELFRQEAVRLEQLGQHPQIPDLKAHFEQEQQLYLVQQLILGQTLAQELQQKGAFKEGQVGKLLKDLLPVLQFIHTRQVIHRDIKPANIIRRPRDGKLVLIDFGVAKLITGTALLHTGTVVGSPEYMAPEQMRGKAMPASDLYSLGVACIHLLTAVSPFDLFDIANDQWAWRDYLPPGNGVNERLAQILDKLLQSGLSRRYTSAAEVLQVLKQPTSFAHNKRARGRPSFLAKIWQASGNQLQKELLTSEVGVDYTKLRDLLATRKWKQADWETWAVMCQVLSQPSASYLHSSDIDKFPCKDLWTINQLWVKYSMGRFGFSVQKQIYESVKGDYGSFCACIGWPTYNPTFPDWGLKFSYSAPRGHLPSRVWVGGVHWWRHAGALASKLATCGIS
jgi:serine/threonine protein kinase